MDNRSKIFLFAILISTTPTLLLSGVNIWTGGRPPAQNPPSILLLAQAPSAPEVIYAVGHTQLYRSTNSGANWAVVYEYPSLLQTRFVVVSQADPNTVFTASHNGQFLKTTNGGRTWFPLEPDSTQPGALWVLERLTGPPETLIAARGSGASADSKSLFLSTDRGATWTSLPLSGVSFRAFASASPNGLILYGIGRKAGSTALNPSFYRSTDGGTTWDELSWPGSGGEEIAIDPVDSKTVYAWDFWGDFFETKDSGTTWKRNQGLSEARVYEIDSVPSNPGVLYASSSHGFFRSSDAGQTWQRQLSELTYDLLLANPTTLLAGTIRGISRSDDAGQTWTDSSSGLFKLEGTEQILSLHADPAQQGIAWAGAAGSGIWKTIDGGSTWSLISNSAVFFSLSPSDPRIMYSVGDKSVRKSTDEGKTWIDLPHTFHGSRIIFPDAHRSDTLYVADTYSIPTPFGGRADTTDRWRSTDGGNTWEKIDFWPRAFHPDTPGVFWGIKDGVSYGLAKTTDSGLTWTAINPSPPSGSAYLVSSPGSLYVSPSDPDVMYIRAFFGGGLYKSTNGGRDWTRAGLEGFPVTAFAIDPARPATLLAAIKRETYGPYTVFNSVFRSDDAGLTWQEFNQEIGNKPVALLAFGPDHTAFAGAQPGGVYFVQLDDSLYFPHLTSVAEGQFTGFAVANLSGSDTQSEFLAYDADGTTISGPMNVKIGPGSQWSNLAGSLLGKGFEGSQRRGWAHLKGVPYAAAGFFSLGCPDLSFLDTAEAIARPLEHFVFPEIRIPPAITRFHIANPGSGMATLSLQLRAASGQLAAPAVNRQVAENGVLVVDLTDLFPASSNFTESMYLEVSSDVPVVPFEQLWRKNESVAGLNGQANGSRLLYCPQYATGPELRSAVSVVNLGGQAGRLSFRFIGDDGVQIGMMESLPIEPFGKLYLSDARLFIQGVEEKTGYLEVSSDGPRVTGSVVFGDPSNQRFASALPLQSAGARKLVYGHLVSSADFFTGLALVNPGSTAVNVSIEVFDRNGQRIKGKTEKIDPGKKISRRLTEYFPELTGLNLDSGYIQVTSDQEVFSYALFGAFDLRFLAAIQGRKY